MKLIMTFSIRKIIAVVVLILAIVLALIGRLDLAAACMFAALAVALLVPE